MNHDEELRRIHERLFAAHKQVRSESAKTERLRAVVAGILANLLRALNEASTALEDIDDPPKP